jgi:hypothetical protein|tara:strand:+ start:203 stop:763 length:561 start_codon:yes stop_codon:yes gene_type:complete
MDLKEYVRTYDEIIPLNTCLNAINLFRSDASYVERVDTPQLESLNVTNRAESGQSPEWQLIHNDIVTAVGYTAKQYAMDMKCETSWPKENAMEQIRLNKYTAELGDHYPKHIDVGGYDSARRFLGFFIYLNDVEEGGETCFDDLDLKIKPVAGRILVFPPTWQYPHSGIVPVSNTKYIMTTYLHYK